MGWFIPLLALAAMGAGTGLQMAGANKARQTANQRTLDELARQSGIQRKAEAEFSTSLAGSETPVAMEQMQRGTEERGNLYSQLQGIPLSTNGNDVLTGTDPATTLRDLSQLQLANRSRAKLGGYETWLLDQAVKNLRAGQNLGILNQQAQRSQAILPMELQDAAHAGDSMSGIGTGLGALGMLLSLGSGSALTGAAGAASAVPQSGYGWLGGR